MGSGGSKQKQKEAKCKSDEVIVEPVTTKANTISVSKPKGMMFLYKFIEVQEVYSPNKVCNMQSTLIEFFKIYA